jgi:hypothetical protein
MKLSLGAPYLPAWCGDMFARTAAACHTGIGPWGKAGLLGECFTDLVFVNRSGGPLRSLLLAHSVTKCVLALGVPQDCRSWCDQCRLVRAAVPLLFCCAELASTGKVLCGPAVVVPHRMLVESLV